MKPSLVLALALAACAGEKPPVARTHAAPASPTLVTTVRGLSAPESVIHDADQDVYFVTNINGNPGARDGNGFISRMKPDGTVDSLHFVMGGRNGVTLNAPKGTAITGDTLWVTDLDAVRGFNRFTGAPLATIEFGRRARRLQQGPALPEVRDGMYLHGRRRAMYLTTMRRRNDGLQNLRRLSSALDDAFGNWPQGQGLEGSITSAWVPACDIFEDKDGIKIVMEVPGVRPDDVKLQIENNMLTIRGEKRQVAEEKADRVHRYERSYGSFERTFSLPSTVDGDRIEADISDGVLTVMLPKAEKARPRQIEVKTGGNRANDERVSLESGSARKATEVAPK
jgi:HSP20 family protein